MNDYETWIVDAASQIVDWRDGGRVHNWRNYISERLQSMWNSFTVEQKCALIEQADNIASAEEWE